MTKTEPSNIRSHYSQKFKPWRKGKGKSGGKAPSLKNQLRSQSRLLQKAKAAAGSASSNDEANKNVQEIENRIRNLEKQIQLKELAELERKYAVKYHHIKFFEKKKLMRMQKRAKRNLEDARKSGDEQVTAKLEEDLRKIEENILYVVHYPKDEKYIALFADRGDGIKPDDEVTSRKRKAIRDKIAKQIAGEEVPLNFKKPTRLQMQTSKKQDTYEEESAAKNENNSLDIGESNKIDQKNETKSDKSSGRSNNSDGHGDSDGDSDSDSSSTSSSSSSSSSSCPSSSSGEDKPKSSQINQDEDEDDDDDDDDFFMSAENANAEETMDVFKRAKEYKFDRDVGSRGDKSKGWVTQKQRPGEFKKRRR